MACTPIAAASTGEPPQGDVDVIVTLVSATGQPAKGICVGVGPVVTIFLAEAGKAGYQKAGYTGPGQTFVRLIIGINQTVRYFCKKSDGSVVEVGSQPFKDAPSNVFVLPTYTVSQYPCG